MFDKPVASMNHAEMILELDKTLANCREIFCDTWSETYSRYVNATHQMDRANAMVKVLPIEVVDAFHDRYTDTPGIEWPE